MISDDFAGALRTLALSSGATIGERVLEAYLLHITRTDPRALPMPLAQRFVALRRRLALAEPLLLGDGRGGVRQRRLTDEEVQAMARAIVDIADALGGQP